MACGEEGMVVVETFVGVRVNETLKNRFGGLCKPVFDVLQVDVGLIE
jgi:hypothetical protein